VNGREKNGERTLLPALPRGRARIGLPFLWFAGQKNVRPHRAEKAFCKKKGADSENQHRKLQTSRSRKLPRKKGKGPRGNARPRRDAERDREDTRTLASRALPQQRIGLRAPDRVQGKTSAPTTSGGRSGLRPALRGSWTQKKGYQQKNSSCAANERAGSPPLQNRLASLTPRRKSFRRGCCPGHSEMLPLQP